MYKYRKYSCQIPVFPQYGYVLRPSSHKCHPDDPQYLHTWTPTPGMILFVRCGLRSACIWTVWRRCRSHHEIQRYRKIRAGYIPGTVWIPPSNLPPRSVTSVLILSPCPEEAAGQISPRYRFYTGSGEPLPLPAVPEETVPRSLCKSWTSPAHKTDLSYQSCSEYRPDRTSSTSSDYARLPLR